MISGSKPEFKSETDLNLNTYEMYVSSVGWNYLFEYNTSETA